MSATPNRAQTGSSRKAHSLRSLRAGAIWDVLPLRDRALLQWLIAGDIVTAQLASLLVYGQLRTAQRRLQRLVELGLVHGFWTGSAQRPRGRYAYTLTRPTRLEVESLVWPHGRPERPPDLPGSPPIHQLATHDVLAAVLRASAVSVPEGLFAWVPERPCSQLFGGFLRPDALAGIRVERRAIALFVERDLGTERGEVLAEKIRRYRSVLSRTPNLAVNVGFVVGSHRRARTVHSLARSGGSITPGVLVITATADELLADPLGAHWSDGHSSWPARDLPSIADAVDWPILAPGCLTDPDTLAAFDDRASAMLPALHQYFR
jgi:Replication-relaxation